MPDRGPATTTAPGRPAVVLAVCCLSLLIAGLDTTAVNVALPAIQRDLDAPVSGLQWTVDSYILTIAGFLMLAGAGADRLGRRRVFQVGLGLFTAASLACSLAPDTTWLVIFRVAQGLGASMLNPVALSIVTNTFPEPRERARAIGIWGGTVGLSLALGPVVGGLLVAVAGWRSVFWITIPIGLAAIVLTALFVPESRAAVPRRPDPVAQVLVVTILGTITYAIIEGAGYGYGSPLIVGLISVGVLAAFGLAAYERRREQPLIEPAFFRSLPFTAASLIAVVAFIGLGGFLFLNTLYLQSVRGYSALHAGLLTVPMAGATALTSPISGRLTARYGQRPPLVAAGLLFSVSALILTTSTPDTALPVLVVAYLVFGVAFGLVNTPITTMAVAGMPRSQAGVSAGIATTARQVGSGLGVAVLGSIVGRGEDFTTASHTGWWILAGGGVLIVVLGVLATTGRAVAGAGRVAARFPDRQGAS